jgi:hypothetical protein
VTFDDLYRDLLTIVSAAGARPDVPAESEAFFSNVIEQFHGSREDCLRYIHGNVRAWFRCVSDLPRWIQDANWQFSEGKPMVFVGQIDIPHSAGYLHDDSSFFVFWNPDTGETKTVIQVY